MALEPWAKAQAERLIAPLGDRWTRVQAVADNACRVAAVLPAEAAELLVAAALVHDVGYAPSLNRLGFRAVDAPDSFARRARSGWPAWSPTTPGRVL
jgi:hypothetical protein